MEFDLAAFLLLLGFLGLGLDRLNSTLDYTEPVAPPTMEPRGSLNGLSIRGIYEYLYRQRWILAAVIFISAIVYYRRAIHNSKLFRVVSFLVRFIAFLVIEPLERFRRQQLVTNARRKRREREHEETVRHIRRELERRASIPDAEGPPPEEGASRRKRRKGKPR